MSERVRRLSTVDFPAFVYPTSATIGMAFFSRRRRCVERTRRTCSRSACRFWMIRRICRRSVSSCVSPGPRVPMGALVPAWRLRWVHMPVSRGSRYSYCASCTCSRPSFVRARWAKISRMSPLRSTTRTPSSSSIARAEKAARVGRLAGLQNHGDRVRARGVHERGKLLHRNFGGALLGVHARCGKPREHRPFSFLRQVLNG